MKSWHPISLIANKVAVLSGYRLELLASNDVRGMIQKLMTWYPDLVVGSESCHLREDFYFTDVYMNVDAHRDIYVCAIKTDVENEIIGMFSFQRNDDARTLLGRLCVVAPEHRHVGVAQISLPFIEEMGLAIGAELLMQVTTLKIPYSQMMVERAGYKLVGIIPAHDRDMIKPGEIKRVYEAMYVKVLAKDDLIVMPSCESLTPQTRALMDYLFRENPLL